MQSTSGFFGKLKARLDKAHSRDSRKNNGATGAPVTVNVYDMLWVNNYINSLGIGVYHTGVVVHGLEYCYGGHPFSHSGIFAMAPRDTEMLGPNYVFKTALEMGYTDFTEADIALVLEDMGPQFQGDQYHLLHRNCNHFSNAFVQMLCGSTLPKWINRLAGVGAKLPFIERSIPRVWLTPRPFTEEEEILHLTSNGPSSASAETSSLRQRPQGHRRWRRRNSSTRSLIERTRNSRHSPIITNSVNDLNGMYTEQIFPSVGSNTDRFQGLSLKETSNQRIMNEAERSSPTNVSNSYHDPRIKPCPSSVPVRSDCPSPTNSVSASVDSARGDSSFRLTTVPSRTIDNAITKHVPSSSSSSECITKQNCESPAKNVCSTCTGNLTSGFFSRLRTMCVQLPESDDSIEEVGVYSPNCIFHNCS